MVRLKGGDPLIFGRAAEEIAACEEANIAVDVVPGITAAQGAAAKLGLPLTDRKRARRVQYVTGHASKGALPGDLDWQSLADPTTTTAIYMPTRTLAALVTRATAEGLDPQTPALAIARATRPDQAVVTAPISELPCSVLPQADPTGSGAGDDWDMHSAITRGRPSRVRLRRPESRLNDQLPRVVADRHRRSEFGYP